TENENVKAELKVAYQSVLIVSLNQPVGDLYKNFSEEVKRRALRDYNYKYNEKIVKVNYFTASFHDSVLLLCRAINHSLESDEDVWNGRMLVNKMKKDTFEGISGTITIGKDGDRVADYALLDQVDTKNGFFEVCSQRECVFSLASLYLCPLNVSTEWKAYSHVKY
ncbi:Atrial natriuretic peptide receptor 1-like protein, partial [Dinothrombium tinctorium]